MLGYGLLTGLKTQVGAEQPGATQTRLASLTGPQTEKLWNWEPPYTLTTTPNSAEVLNAPQNLLVPWFDCGLYPGLCTGNLILWALMGETFKKGA